jgi:hypothetical protein
MLLHFLGMEEGDKKQMCCEGHQTALKIMNNFY